MNGDEMLLVKSYAALAYALGLCEGAGVKGLDWLCEIIDLLEKRLVGGVE